MTSTVNRSGAAALPAAVLVLLAAILPIAVSLTAIAPPAAAKAAEYRVAEGVATALPEPPGLANSSAAASSPDDTTRSRTVTLELDQAVDLALAESYDARALKLRLIEAEQDVAAARGRFRTQADLDLSLPTFQEQVQGVQAAPGELPEYGTYGQLEWRGGLGVRQPLPTDGSLALTATLYQRRDSYIDPVADERSEDQSFFQSYRLQLEQPLFVPNTLQLGLERARLDLEQAQRSYTRTQLDVIYDVTSAFYGLLRAQRSRTIAEDAVQQQEEAFALARQKYESGLIPEVEALQMEVDLAQSRNDLLSAEGRLARAADTFRLVVGLSMTAPIAVAAATEPAFYPVDARLALEHALAHRAEIHDAETAARLAEITLEETDARSTIRGELRAYYDLVGISQGIGDNPSLDDQITSSWQDLRRRPGNRGVSFALSVPLWDSGVNEAEVAAATAVLSRRDLDREQTVRQVQRQVQAALTGLDEARSRLEALSRSREVAARSFEISQQRFANGDITSQELALDRDRLTQSRTAFLDAYIQYELAGADLRRQTLYDFATGRSLVAD